jgi:hypothetical protein
MGDTGELMLHSLDLDCSDCRSRERTKQNTAQTIAQGDTETGIQRLDSKPSISFRATFGFYFGIQNLQQRTASSGKN